MALSLAKSNKINDICIRVPNTYSYRIPIFAILCVSLFCFLFFPFLCFLFLCLKHALNQLLHIIILLLSAHLFNGGQTMHPLNGYSIFDSLAHHKREKI